MTGLRTTRSSHLLQRAAAPPVSARPARRGFLHRRRSSRALPEMINERVGVVWDPWALTDDNTTRDHGQW